MSSAVSQDDGLAVLGVLFELQDDDDGGGGGEGGSNLNLGLSSLTSASSAVKEAGSSQPLTTEQTFPVGDLLPENRAAFFRSVCSQFPVMDVRTRLTI